MFNDWNRAMRELRYLNGIPKYGPKLGDISRGLRVNNNVYRQWLVDATYRWPIFEDDNGGIHLGL